MKSLYLLLILVLFPIALAAEIYRDDQGGLNLVSTKGDVLTITNSRDVYYNKNFLENCDSDSFKTKLINGGVLTCDQEDLTLTISGTVFTVDSTDAQIVEGQKIEQKEISTITNKIIITPSSSQIKIEQRNSNAQINQKISTDKEIKTIIKGDDILIEMQNEVLFDFDSAAVQDQAATILTKLASLIKENLEGYLIIAGHTDSIGSREYNLELSEKRAAAVAAWLHKNANIELSDIRTIGYGEDFPIALNVDEKGLDNPEGRKLNRRVEFAVQTIRKDPEYLLRGPNITSLDREKLSSGVQKLKENTRTAVQSGVAGAREGINGLVSGLNAAAEAWDE